jgi:hypothetical protein
MKVRPNIFPALRYICSYDKISWEVLLRLVVNVIYLLPLLSSYNPPIFATPSSSVLSPRYLESCCLDASLLGDGHGEGFEGVYCAEAFLGVGNEWSKKWDQSDADLVGLGYVEVGRRDSRW